MTIYPPETRAEAIRRHLEGVSIRSVAAQMNLPYQTIQTWVY